MSALAAGALLISRMAPAGGYMDSVFPGFIFLGVAIGTIGAAGSISVAMGVPQLQHGLATVWVLGREPQRREQLVPSK